MRNAFPSRRRLGSRPQLNLARKKGFFYSLNGIVRLTGQLNAIAEASELREYVMTHYLLLYAQIKGTTHLLSIRHHRQLSFDLAGHWPM